MSDQELIRKYYFGSYKINSKGYLACPLYDEKQKERNQLCDFSVQNQNDDFTDDVFNHFWTHVQSTHPDTYVEIIETCRSKISNTTKENRRDKLYDLLGSTFANLNKLVGSWTDTGNGAEFLGQFQNDLQSLENKVRDLITPTAQSNTTTNTTSLTNL